MKFGQGERKTRATLSKTISHINSSMTLKLLFLLFLSKILRDKPWEREREKKIESFEREKEKKRKTRLREREKSRIRKGRRSMEKGFETVATPR